MKIFYLPLILLNIPYSLCDTCPYNYPYAFENGKSCCKYGVLGDYFGDVKPDFSPDFDSFISNPENYCFSKNRTYCYNNDFMKCPSVSNCEDCKYFSALTNRVITNKRAS